MTRRDREIPHHLEIQMYEWLLAQRLLHDVGALDPVKAERLDAATPGWFTPITDADTAHAIFADDEEMNAALEVWWNAKGMRGTPITFAEIRLMAAMES